MVRPLSSSNPTEAPRWTEVVRNLERSAAVIDLAPLKARPKIPQPLSLHTLQVSSLGADILLPAKGNAPEATFRAYADRIHDERIFPPKETAILREIGTEASPSFDPDQPVVGVMCNDPMAFRGEGGIREIVEAVQKIGCRVVLIPPCADVLMPSDPAGRANGILSMVRRLDGLIGPGGVDIDPAIYGEKNTYSEDVNPRVDRFQADFWLAAKNESLFMFGLCRTHQLFNAADGGSLVQDVVAEGFASREYRQRRTRIPFDEPFIFRDESGRVTFEYRVQLDPESRMTEVARTTSFATNANHHQLLERAGEGMTVVGWMHDPGTHRDLMVATERWNAFTVQWHPESMQSDPIQQRLLGTAGRRAKLFRAAKRLSQSGQRVTSQSIEAWYRSRFGVLDRSDSQWIRRDLIPHWYGKLAATGSVDGR